MPAFRDVIGRLYLGLDALGGACLQAAALHLGEAADRFSAMAVDSDALRS